MILVIEIRNNDTKNLLKKYGEIIYESKTLDLIYLCPCSKIQMKDIVSLPGVVSVKNETIGELHCKSFVD